MGEGVKISNLMYAQLVPKILPVKFVSTFAVILVTFDAFKPSDLPVYTLMDGMSGLRFNDAPRLLYLQHDKGRCEDIFSKILSWSGPKLTAKMAGCNNVY